jgi:hypothetical protein
MAKERSEDPTEAREAFARGVARGKDPAREAAGGVVVTTLRSPWLGQPCRRCEHTFRRGDRVEAGAGADAAHAGGCPDERGAASAADPPERAAFYAGLAAAHPPPADLRLVRLGPGHPLLGEGRAPFRRPTCAVCGHSLRPFDEVVVCPCQPEAPLCRAAVHRDSIRALHCWDEWSKSKLASYCPVTSRKLT